MTDAPSPTPDAQPALSSTLLAKVRTHLANERTHLAYLRTTVSLIGFGITINRFSLYLIQNDDAPHGTRLFLRDVGNAGFGMVLLGLALLVWSLYRYWRVSLDIERGLYVPRHKGMIVASIGLLLMGGLTALWLFSDPT
ncbi:MAG: YidH family protein [Stenotrophomonas sp.]|uniref:YidH family protein n=1 Tax=Stenotrophomonas sp. TaxID=69392 RepID=UPI003D6CB5B8